MRGEKYYRAYEQRYSRVYSSGARYWNEHRPSRALERFLSARNPVGDRVLEMGCGEGFEARFLAERGFIVTAVDISPTVVEKCRRELEGEDLNIDCRLGDITRLDFLPSATFALVVAIGSYHMLHDPEDRRRCLAEARRLLLPGGFLFLQNGLDLKQAEVFFPEERREIVAFRKIRQGKTVTRALETGKGSREVTVPVTPRTFFGRLEDFEEEVEAGGFTVLDAYPTNEDRINAGWEAVVVGVKPS